MKRLTLITILFVFLSNYLFAQWSASGNNIYNTNTGSIAVGATNPYAINASAGMFPSIIPRTEIFGTGSSASAFTDLLSIRHSGVTVDAVSRQLGIVFKLSSESSTAEADKMGGLILESSNPYANTPAMSLLTANTRRLTIDYYGNVGVNTTDTKGYKFAVNGTAVATAVTVKLNANWPDYVFKKDYTLPALSDVKAFIDQNQHLPEIPSEQEIAKNGQNLGEMNKLLLKKVEELTLYLIENQKQINELKIKVSLLEASHQ
jgi:hypothetical protein